MILNITFGDLLKREVYLHLLFWLFFITFPLLKYLNDDYILVQFFTGNSNLFLSIIYAYVCYLFLFPRKMKYKSLIIIVFTILMTFLGVMFSNLIISLVIHQIDNYSYWIHGLGIIGEYFLVGILFFSFYIIKRNYQLEKERRIAELNSLKAQINPHFLFNTLNSIYSYTLDGNEKASQLILKLSDNFKYILHQGQKQEVDINEDLNYIKDFMSLQKLRWQDKIDFIFTESLINNDLKISPLITITFVENAIKYASKLKGTQHKIKIDYFVENNKLLFKCVNPYDESYLLLDQWEQSGIGLKNTKRRLNLIYENKHTLNIEQSDSEFKINLSINL